MSIECPNCGSAHVHQEDWGWEKEYACENCDWVGGEDDDVEHNPADWFKHSLDDIGEDYEY